METVFLTFVGSFTASCTCYCQQALNFTREEVQQLSSGKGHLYDENVCIGTLQKGFTAKTQGTMAIDVCVMSYF